MSDSCDCCQPQSCACDTCTVAGFTQVVGTWDSDGCALTCDTDGGIILGCKGAANVTLNSDAGILVGYHDSTHFTYLVVTSTGWEEHSVSSGVDTVVASNDCMELEGDTHLVQFCSNVGHGIMTIDGQIALDVGTSGTKPNTYGFYAVTSAASISTGDEEGDPCPPCVSPACRPRDFLEHNFIYVDFSEFSASNGYCSACGDYFSGVYELALQPQLASGGSVTWQYCKKDICSFPVREYVCDHSCCVPGGCGTNSCNCDCCDEDDSSCLRGDLTYVVTVTATLLPGNGACQWHVSFLLAPYCGASHAGDDTYGGGGICGSSDSKSGDGTVVSCSDSAPPGCGLYYGVSYVSQNERCPRGSEAGETSWVLGLIGDPLAHANCDGGCDGVSYPDTITVSTDGSADHTDSSCVESSQNWYVWTSCFTHHTDAGPEHFTIYGQGNQGVSISDVYILEGLPGPLSNGRCWRLTNKVTTEPGGQIFSPTLRQRKISCDDTSAPSCVLAACCTNFIDYVDITIGQVTQGAVGALCHAVCRGIASTYRIFTDPDSEGDQGGEGVQDISFTCSLEPGPLPCGCDGADLGCAKCLIDSIAIQWTLCHNNDGCWLDVLIQVLGTDQYGSVSTNGQALYRTFLTTGDPPIDCAGSYTLDRVWETGLLAGDETGDPSSCKIPIQITAVIVDL